jgi:hypothetical protein
MEIAGTCFAPTRFRAAIREISVAIETVTPTSVASNTRAPPLSGVAGEFTDKVADALSWGKSGISDSASAAKDSLQEDVANLRKDFASVAETLSRFISESTYEAGKTARRVGDAVGTAAADLGDTGVQMAGTAKESVITFASELEGMARRQPIGALAGAFVFGIVVGIVTRSRN